MKPLAHYIEVAGISIDQLIKDSGLEKQVVRAIVAGNYTPSPTQRERLAAVVGVSVDEVSWDHAVPVQHMRGNGPQVGRST
jgi:ribosome-binding protein aMBF1 (putative translation factor)